MCGISELGGWSGGGDGSSGPYTSAASSARINEGPPGISSSRSTALGCKRARDSIQETYTVIEDGDEMDSAAKPATAHGGHEWTHR